MNNYENINNVLTNAIKQLSEIGDINMIIGSPQKLDDKIVIPVCRVTVGFISGGGEYGEVKIFQKDNKPLIGASGGVMNIVPSGFLVEDLNGIKYIDCPNNAVEKVINICDDLIKGVK